MANAATDCLLLPDGATKGRILWPYVMTLAIYHLIALLALTPWFFSATGVVLMIVGLYVFGTFGINLAYHRLLTHRGLVCPKWLEYTLAILGVCCMQDIRSLCAVVCRRRGAHTRHGCPQCPAGKRS